jgi:hypothetical protein
MYLAIVRFRTIVLTVCARKVEGMNAEAQVVSSRSRCKMEDFDSVFLWFSETGGILS